ncbi:MAG: nucleotide sugar dehydrogenase [Victivallaceae bacterium]|nr:nucleotide sugar dehydrogenase [Victivallaceae bacterium]
MNILEKIDTRTAKIAVIGLGYVGLPLAAEFGKFFHVIGFDVKEERLKELSAGADRTGELSPEELAQATKLTFSSDPDQLKDRDIFIVTVPTPVNLHKEPDLTPLVKASATVGKALKRGAIVIYESTVYPGCTEEECVPVLEQHSHLTFNQDFFCGYSPERINPGDKVHRVGSIRKITSGSTPEIAEAVDRLYRTIITAGTYRAESLKVAEAAKVIENSQRDLNIAFVNELAKIFHLIGIDTNAVLEAAGTKWNFLPFRPGLVGGHCIGVDPYYLTYKAQSLGYLPEVILSGRRINDGMGAYIATEVVKLLIRNDERINHAPVLVLGITFKENCNDVRNSKAADVVHSLQEFGCEVTVCDPLADPVEVRREYQIESRNDPQNLVLEDFSAVVLTVAHDAFRTLDFSNFSGVLYDVKGFFPREKVSGRL